MHPPLEDPLGRPEAGPWQGAASSKAEVQPSLARHRVIGRVTGPGGTPSAPDVRRFSSVPEDVPIAV
jgi:hypothetical protein